MLTAIAFPVHTYDSPAQPYPTSLGASRTSAGISSVAGNFVLTDSVAVGATGAANYTDGYCVPSVTRYCRLIITPPSGAFPAIAPIDVAVINNTANTVTTATNIAAYSGPFFKQDGTPLARPKYSLVAYNAGVAWFADRQPARTTTP